MTDETQVVFDPNLVYEEDIDEAMILCSKMFGPVGRYVYPAKCVTGVIYTPKYGKLWYGDIPSDDLNKLVDLQDKLNDEVTVIAL